MSLPGFYGYDGHSHAHMHPSRRAFGPQRLHWPSPLIEQDFGLPLSPDDLLVMTIHNEDYYGPWRHVTSSVRDMSSSIKTEKDKFQVNLDVQHFAPEEISVKTVDIYVVVEGKHEEKKDEHGYISRHFVRRYALPEGALPETVESRLSSDGVLTITAPRSVPDLLKEERKVKILQTGPVRKVSKEDHRNLEHLLFGHGMPAPGNVHVHTSSGKPRVKVYEASPGLIAQMAQRSQMPIPAPAPPAAQAAPAAQAEAEGAAPPATTEEEK